jgi:methyl-branched lipid omega-hydroxylase
VTTPRPAATPADINLARNDFWALEPAKRHDAFARLRTLPQPAFFPEPEVAFANPDGGYYAFVRHADINEASRHPELFSSARGATSIADLPAEFNEYFGSMINMDDPRHARLRRIVSRAFTPKMIRRFEENVQLAAASIVDDLLATGPCDFVGQVSARLPLKIICDIMGIGAAPGGARRRPDDGTGHCQPGRRAAHAGRTGLVLHPAGRRRKRDHQDGDLSLAGPAD